MSRQAFIDKLYQARSITREQTGNIRTQLLSGGSLTTPKNKMAYYFAVLEDVLGLRDGQESTPPLPT